MRLQDKVVVITGASSGIGRATALKFARKGATVVVAARREEPLREVAEECERLAGRSLAVITDVTREREVETLARRTVETFGRIDVWVNNASVTLFSRFEEAPPDDYRRVIETNLFGYIHGARAVLPYFREQGHGVLINNATVFAKVGAPYISAYVTSKFGIRGFSECLRTEVQGDGIEVCTVLPASIDTPLFQHAGNFTGRAIQPLKPIYSAEKVARAIVRCAVRPRPELIVGRSGWPLPFVRSLMPRVYDRMIFKAVDSGHFQEAQAEPTSGNLHRAMPAWTSTDGGWRPHRAARFGALALAVAGAGAGLWWASPKGRAARVTWKASRTLAPAVARMAINRRRGRPLLTGLVG